MSPNERDTEPPAPDATAAPEREDPWSWRAYPDEAPPEDAESPVSEEPAAAAVDEEPAAAAVAEAPAGPAEEPRAGGEAIGLSDWDERVRLLERVEPGEPADFREQGDFWDPGARDEATEAAADTVEIPRAPRAEPPGEPPPAPPWWPPPPTPTLRPP